MIDRQTRRVGSVVLIVLLSLFEIATTVPGFVAWFTGVEGDVQEFTRVARQIARLLMLLIAVLSWRQIFNLDRSNEAIAAKKRE